MKICGTCKKEQPDDCFGVRKASKDGLAAKCKSCQSIYDKSRANDPKRAKARAAYQKTDRGRQAGNAAKARYTERNAIKKGASTMVGNAVRDGRLSKPTNCEACGSMPTRLHGHHDDYSLPLVVRWLCPDCHSKWHGENGPGANA